MQNLPGIDKALDKISNAFGKNVKVGFYAKVIGLYDPGNLFNDQVKEGDTITGYYVHDRTTKDTNTDNTVGDYEHHSSPYGITVKAGNLEFKTDPKNVNFLVELVNRDLDDHYLLRSYTNLPLANGASVEHISWQLDNDTGTAISSDSLKKAPTPPKLDDWIDPFRLTITGGDGFDNSFFLRAHVESVHLIK